MAVKKTSEAEKRRINKGLPLSATPPDLSAKRMRASGVGLGVRRIAAGQSSNAIKSAMDYGSKIEQKQQLCVGQSRALAREAAPKVVQRLVELAAGWHKASVRDQIVAGRLVLEVAGALAPDAGRGEDTPLHQMSAAALARTIDAGEQRIAQLEAILAAQEAHTIQGEADQVVEEDGAHRIPDPVQAAPEAAPVLASEADYLLE